MKTDLLIIAENDLSRLQTFELHDALRGKLERAIVVAADAVPRDVVRMNSHVLYVDESSGDRHRVQVVYPTDANASGARVSVLAPVGAALLGLSAGQAIEWDFPDGGRRRLRVEDVGDEPRPTA